LKTRLSLIVVLAALLPLYACDGVTFVERIVVVNETDYSANVDVRGNGGAWLGLTTVSPHDSREVGQVIDQGPLWIFRFSYGRQDSVELDISRNELVEAGWRVEVPSELEENLRAEGVTPPP
jgi:hypothetical protein